MSDLWGDIQECARLLDLALKESGERGSRYVMAEAEYYSQKSRTALALKGEGFSATMIDTVIKGMPEVTEKLLAFHMAQIEYENAREARNVYKKKLDTFREQYQREWSQSGRND